MAPKDTETRGRCSATGVVRGVDDRDSSDVARTEVPEGEARTAAKPQPSLGRTQRERTAVATLRTYP